MKADHLSDKAHMNILKSTTAVSSLFAAAFAYSSSDAKAAELSGAIAGYVQTDYADGILTATKKNDAVRSIGIDGACYAMEKSNLELLLSAEPVTITAYDDGFCAKGADGSGEGELGELSEYLLYEVENHVFDGLRMHSDARSMKLVWKTKSGETKNVCRDIVASLTPKYDMGAAFDALLSVAAFSDRECKVKLAEEILVTEDPDQDTDTDNGTGGDTDTDAPTNLDDPAVRDLTKYTAYDFNNDGVKDLFIGTNLAGVPEMLIDNDGDGKPDSVIPLPFIPSTDTGDDTTDDSGDDNGDDTTDDSGDDTTDDSGDDTTDDNGDDTTDDNGDDTTDDEEGDAEEDNSDALVDAGQNQDGSVDVTSDDNIGRGQGVVKAIKVGDSCVILENGKISLGADLHLTAASVLQMFSDEACTQKVSETTLGELLTREDREKLASLINVAEDENGNLVLGGKDEDLFSDKPAAKSVKIGDECKPIANGEVANLGKRDALDANAMVALFSDDACSADKKLGEAKLGDLLNTVDKLAKDGTVEGDYVDAVYHGDSLDIVRKNSDAKSVKLIGASGKETCLEFAGKVKLNVPGGQLFDVESAEVFEEAACAGDPVESLDLSDLHIAASIGKVDSENGAVADNGDKLAIKRKNENAKSALLTGEDAAKNMCVNFADDSDIAYINKTKLKQEVGAVEYYDAADCRGNKLATDDLSDLGIEPKEGYKGPTTEGKNATATYDAATDALKVDRKNTDADSVGVVDENDEIIEGSCKNFAGKTNVTIDKFSELESANKLRFFDSNDCAGEKLEDLDVANIVKGAGDGAEGCVADVAAAHPVDELVKFAFEGNTLTATRLNSELVESVKIGEQVYDFNGRVKLEIAGVKDARGAEIIDCNGEAIPVEDASAPRLVEGDKADVGYNPVDDEVSVDKKDDAVKSAGALDENGELIDGTCQNFEGDVSQVKMGADALKNAAKKVRVFDGVDCQGATLEDIDVSDLDVGNVAGEDDGADEPKTTQGKNADVTYNPTDKSLDVKKTDDDVLSAAPIDENGDVIPDSCVNFEEGADTASIPLGGVTKAVKSIRLFDGKDCAGKTLEDVPTNELGLPTPEVDACGEDAVAGYAEKPDDLVTFKMQGDILVVTRKDSELVESVKVGDKTYAFEGKLKLELPGVKQTDDVEIIGCDGKTLSTKDLNDDGSVGNPDDGTNDEACAEDAIAGYAAKPDDLVTFAMEGDVLVATRKNSDLVESLKVGDQTYAFEGKLKLELPGVKQTDDIQIIGCDGKTLSTKDLNDDGSVGNPDDGNPGDDCPLPAEIDDPMNFISFKFEKNGLRILRKDSCALCIDLGEHGKFSLAGKKDIFLDDVKSPKDITEMRIYSDEACTQLLTELGGEGDESCPSEDLAAIKNMTPDQMVTFKMQGDVLVATRQDSTLIDALKIGTQTYAFEGKMKLEIPGVKSTDDIQIIGCDGQPISTKDLNDDGSSDACPEDVTVPENPDINDLVSYERDGETLRLTRLDSKLVSAVKVGDQTFDFTGNAKLEIPGYAGKTAEVLDCNGDVLAPIPDEGSCVASGPVKDALPEDFVSYQIKDGTLTVKKEDDRAGGISLAGEKHMFEDGETELQVENFDVDALDSIEILNCDGKVISLFATGICSYSPTEEESDVVFEGDGTNYFNYIYEKGQLKLFRVDSDVDSISIPGVVECMDVKFKKEIKPIKVALEDLKKIVLYDFVKCDTPIAEMTVKSANLDAQDKKAGEAALKKKGNAGTTPVTKKKGNGTTGETESETDTTDTTDETTDAAKTTKKGGLSGAKFVKGKFMKGAFELEKFPIVTVDEDPDCPNDKNGNPIDPEKCTARPNEEDVTNTTDETKKKEEEDSTATDETNADDDQILQTTAAPNKRKTTKGVTKTNAVDVKNGHFKDGPDVTEDEDEESGISQEVRDKNKDSDVKVCVPNKTVNQDENKAEEGASDEAGDGLVICTEFDPIDPKSPKIKGDESKNGDAAEDGGQKDEDPSVEGDGSTGSDDASDNAQDSDVTNPNCATDENGEIIDPEKCKETQGEEDGTETTDAYKDFMSDDKAPAGAVNDALVKVGELRNKWSPVTINVTAPKELCATITELANNSMYVRFEDAKGTRYVVPGYIKGDAGASCGVSWQARFTPPASGDWKYRLYMNAGDKKIDGIDRTEGSLKMGESRGEGFYSLGYVSAGKPDLNLLRVGPMVGTQKSDKDFKYMFMTAIGSAANDMTDKTLTTVVSSLTKTDANMIGVNLASYLNAKNELDAAGLAKLSSVADQLQQRSGAPVSIALSLDGMTTLKDLELETYLEDMIGRFGYLNGLVWVVPAKGDVALVKKIRELDAHKHPIAVHALIQGKAGGADMMLMNDAMGSFNSGIVALHDTSVKNVKKDTANLDMWGYVMSGIGGVNVLFDTAAGMATKTTESAAMVEASVSAASFFAENVDLSYAPVSACKGQCIVFGDMLIGYVEKGKTLTIDNADLLKLADKTAVGWYDPTSHKMLELGSTVGTGGAVAMPAEAANYSALVAVVMLNEPYLGSGTKIDDTVPADETVDDTTVDDAAK
ncbi:MAG: DUF5060 domain-containing protein [Rickettsiales bacterium]